MHSIKDRKMFKRKIINELTAWKNSTGKKKALVIKGLRQIGKTYSVCAFAKENYENVIYINFKNDSSAKKVFAGDFNVDRITLDLSALMPKVRFVPYKTVLIFDEVQECSDARASIKEFMLDGRYDIICTGSLLGIKGYNKKPNRGVPTGFEHIVYMKPMDFEEFLWAKGINDDVLAELRRCYEEKVPVSESLHNSMLRYFKEYICVGGLPYVVDRFLSTNDMNVVYSEQKDIIEAIIGKEGMNYGALPKGLLTFHRYPDGSTRTPLEEQLMEGAQTAATNGAVNVHFTVSAEHEGLFRHCLVERGIKHTYHRSARHQLLAGIDTD